MDVHTNFGTFPKMQFSRAKWRYSKPIVVWLICDGQEKLREHSQGIR